MLERVIGGMSLFQGGGVDLTVGGQSSARYRKCRNIEKLWTAHSTDPEFRTEPMYSEF